MKNHSYTIATDNATMTIEAADVAEALAIFGAPATTLEEFADWLRSTGGYGHIDRDGVCMVRVAVNA